MSKPALLLDGRYLVDTKSGAAYFEIIDGRVVVGGSSKIYVLNGLAEHAMYGYARVKGWEIREARRGR